LRDRRVITLLPRSGRMRSWGKTVCAHNHPVANVPQALRQIRSLLGFWRCCLAQTPLPCGFRRHALASLTSRLSQPCIHTTHTHGSSLTGLPHRSRHALACFHAAYCSRQRLLWPSHRERKRSVGASPAIVPR
jgi:hypothetical protein